jgi:hypothetical protein
MLKSDLIHATHGPLYQWNHVDVVERLTPSKKSIEGIHKTPQGPISDPQGLGLDPSIGTAESTVPSYLQKNTVLSLRTILLFDAISSKPPRLSLKCSNINLFCLRSPDNVRAINSIEPPRNEEHHRTLCTKPVVGI